MDEYLVAKMRLIGSYSIMKMLQIQFAVFPTAVLQQGARSLAGSCNTPQIQNTKYNARNRGTTKGTRKILLSGFFSSFYVSCL